MSKKLMVGWIAVVGFGILIAVEAVAGAASTGRAKPAVQTEQTRQGAVTDSYCECVCASPSPGGTPCE